MIENIHQHGRDIFRSSKANSISNTAIMANALRSGVLQQREVNSIVGTVGEKAMGPAWLEECRQEITQRNPDAHGTQEE